MWRRLTAWMGIVVATVWAATMAVWTRGGCRTDSAYVVSDRHVFWNLATGGGVTRLTRATSWPAPLVAAWVSGPADPSALDTPAADPLFGPATFSCPYRGGQWHGAFWDYGTQDVPTGQPPPARPDPAVGGRASDAIDWRAGPSSPVTYGRVAVPTAWLPAAASALGMPWVLLIGRRWWQSHERRRRGLCVGCGYDLRHSPDRCPECGAVGA